MGVHHCGNFLRGKWKKSNQRERRRRAFGNWRFKIERRSTWLAGFSQASMRPLKTISFLEGENGMSVDVACQQFTGTQIGHPFLHRVSADLGGSSRQQVSFKFSQFQSRTGHIRSIWAKLGKFEPFQGSGRVSEKVKGSFGESGSQYCISRRIVRHGQRNSIGAVD